MYCYIPFQLSEITYHHYEILAKANKFFSAKSFNLTFTILTSIITPTHSPTNPQNFNRFIMLSASLMNGFGTSTPHWQWWNACRERVVEQRANERGPVKWPHPSAGGTAPLRNLSVRHRTNSPCQGKSGAATHAALNALARQAELGLSNKFRSNKHPAKLSGL